MFHARARLWPTSGAKWSHGGGACGWREYHRAQEDQGRSCCTWIETDLDAPPAAAPANPGAADFFEPGRRRALPGN